MDEKYIGNKLKLLRQEKYMRQSDLAEVLNVSTSTISHWEKARRTPSILELKRIADYFQIDISEIVESADSNLEKSNTRDINTPNLVVKRTIPTVIPGLRIYLMLYSLTCALLVSTVFLSQLLGYVVFYATSLAYVAITIVYFFSHYYYSKLAEKFFTHKINTRHIFRHTDESIDVERERQIILSIIILSFICVFLFYFFYILSLLVARTFAIFPFSVTVVGMVVVTCRTLLYRSIAHKNPFVYALSIKDKRLMGSNLLLHSIMLLDGLPIIFLVYLFLYFELPSSGTFISWIVIFGLLSFILDMYANYRYQTYVDGFKLLDRLNGLPLEKDRLEVTL